MKQYRLRHGHSEVLHCLQCDCPCSFKTCGALKSHLSRKHSTSQLPKAFVSSVNIAVLLFPTRRVISNILEFILKKKETVRCVFKDYHYETNVKGTFASHRSRNHTAHSSIDFLAEIVHKYQSNITDDIEEAQSCDT